MRSKASVPLELSLLTAAARATGAAGGGAAGVGWTGAANGAGGGPEAVAVTDTVGRGCVRRTAGTERVPGVTVSKLRRGPRVTGAKGAGEGVGGGAAEAGAVGAEGAAGAAGREELSKVAAALREDEEVVAAAEMVVTAGREGAV